MARSSALATACPAPLVPEVARVVVPLQGEAGGVGAEVADVRLVVRGQADLSLRPATCRTPLAGFRRRLTNARKGKRGGGVVMVVG